MSGSRRELRMAAPRLAAPESFPLSAARNESRKLNLLTGRRRLRPYSHQCIPELRGSS